MTSNFNSSKNSQALSSSFSVSPSGIFFAVNLACRSPCISACPDAFSYQVCGSRLLTSGPKMFVCGTVKRSSAAARRSVPAVTRLRCAVRVRSARKAG
jgi:hypothetical protein